MGDIMHDCEKCGQEIPDQRAVWIFPAMLLFWLLMTVMLNAISRLDEWLTS